MRTAAAGSPLASWSRADTTASTGARRPSSGSSAAAAASSPTAASSLARPARAAARSSRGGRPPVAPRASSRRARAASASPARRRRPARRPGWPRPAAPGGRRPGPPGAHPVEGGDGGAQVVAVVGADGQSQVGAGQLGARRPVDPPGVLGGLPGQLLGQAQAPPDRLEQGQVGGDGQRDHVPAPPVGVGPGPLEGAGGVVELAAPELGGAQQGEGQGPVVVAVAGRPGGHARGRGQQHPDRRPGVGHVADQPGPVQPGQVHRLRRLPGEARLGGRGQPQPGVGLLQLPEGEPAEGGHHGQLRGGPDPLAGQPRQQLGQHGRLALGQHRRPAGGEQGGRLVDVAGGQGVADGRHRLAVGGVPGGRPAVQLRQLGGVLVAQLGPEQLGEQGMVAVPGPVGADGRGEHVLALQPGQHPGAVRPAGQRVGQVPAEPVGDRRPQQERPQLGGLGGQHLLDQVAGDGPVVAGQVGHEPPRLGMGRAARGRPAAGRRPSPRSAATAVSRSARDSSTPWSASSAPPPPG